MLKLSDEAKAKYAKYLDANGKLIIDDTLPEDVKKAFNYFNSRNINIMQLNVNDDIIDLPEEEVNDSDLDDDVDFDDGESDELFDDEEDENVNLDDLNNLF